ncbi:anthrone oxygenase family protein [Micromonospora sp. NPDC003944]
MDVLMFATVAVLGFTACAEFGSYAFVHPVVKRLAPRDHIMVEQGLLRTFGIVMPVAMTASLVLAISYAARPDGAGLPEVLRWAAAAAWATGIVTTVVVNVPINLSTLRWDKDSPPERWQERRNRWEWFQGYRSWAYLAAFLLVVLSIATVD